MGPTVTQTMAWALPSAPHQARTWRSHHVAQWATGEVSDDKFTLCAVDPDMPGESANFKVCICGAAGGIGQPLAMLMIVDQRVSELALVDIKGSAVPVEGVTADLNQIETDCQVKAYSIE